MPLCGNSLTAKKIGARIRQARKMAGFKTLAQLNEKLTKKYKWSASRLGNYETGHSAPGPVEVCILAKETGTSPCWMMFDSGPIRSNERDLQAIRHQNLTRAVEDREEDKSRYQQFLEKAETNAQAIRKYIDNPFRKIGDRQARRFERALGKSRGWMDEQHVEDDPICKHFPDDLREMMMLFSDLDVADRQRLLEITKIMQKR